MVDLKQSYPLKSVEYAIGQGIDKTPVFAWWIPYVLRKRRQILTAVRSWYHKWTHKFGFEILKMVKRAHEIATENGNMLWQDALVKEMVNGRIAFKILPDGLKEPVGHQYMECHLIFEIKLDGFSWKVWLVTRGHMTETPAVMTYASVVS